MPTRTTARSSSQSPARRRSKRTTPHSAHQIRLNQPSRLSQSSLPPLPPPFALPPTVQATLAQQPACRSHPSRSKSRSFDSLVPPGFLPDLTPATPPRLTPLSRRQNKPRAQRRSKRSSLEPGPAGPDAATRQTETGELIVSPTPKTPDRPITKLQVAPTPAPATPRVPTPHSPFQLDHGQFPPLVQGGDASSHTSPSDSNSQVWVPDRPLKRRFRLENESFPPLRPTGQSETQIRMKRSRQKETEVHDKDGEDVRPQDGRKAVQDARQEERRGDEGESGKQLGSEGRRGTTGDDPDCDDGAQSNEEVDNDDEAVMGEDGDDVVAECHDSEDGRPEESEGIESECLSCDFGQSGIASDSADAHGSPSSGPFNPSGSRDSAGHSSERAAPTISEIFAPYDEPFKTANEMLLRLELQQGGLKLNRSLQPELEKEAENDILPPRSRSFRKLMTMITEEQGVDLSTDDFELFDELPGISSFKYDNCFSQLQTTGMCVEVPKGTALPEATEDAWVFEYGPEERKVMVFPKVLSPLGLSVLSWILMPGPYTVATFVNVMKAVTFKNCLVDQVVQSVGLWSSLKQSLWRFALRTVTDYVSDPGTIANLSSRLLGRAVGPQSLVEAQESKYVVVPRSWLYWLNIKHRFVQEHGSYGDMAVKVGRPSQDSRSSGWFSVISRASSSASSSARGLMDFFSASSVCSRNGEEPSSLALHFGENPDAEYEDGGRPIRNGTEYLQIDRDNQLVYTKVVKQKELRNVSVGANLPVGGLNFGFNREYVPGYIELEKYRMGSIPVPFGSLSQYVGFQMKDSSQRSLLRRMKWLEEALNRKAIFPEGSNQIFLKLTTGYASTNRSVPMFEEDDCRISRFDLKKSHRVEQRHMGDPGKLYFIEDGNGTEVFAAKCYARGSDLWEIEPPCLEEYPIGTTFLSRDLG